MTNDERTKQLLFPNVARLGQTRLGLSLGLSDGLALADEM